MSAIALQSIPAAPGGVPFNSMRTEGIEPPRPFGHEHLKLARLPGSATSAGMSDSRNAAELRLGHAPASVHVEVERHLAGAEAPPDVCVDVEGLVTHQVVAARRPVRGEREAPVALDPRRFELPKAAPATSAHVANPIKIRTEARAGRNMAR